MTGKAKRWYWITEDDLLRLADYSAYPGADEAAEKVRKIKDSGNTPAIYYTEFSGFRILNEDDPEQFEISRSIRSSAKRFPIKMF